MSSSNFFWTATLSPSRSHADDSLVFTKSHPWFDTIFPAKQNQSRLKSNLEDICLRILEFSPVHDSARRKSPRKSSSPATSIVFVNYSGKSKLQSWHWSVIPNINHSKLFKHHNWPTQVRRRKKIFGMTWTYCDRRSSQVVIEFQRLTIIEYSQSWTINTRDPRAESGSTFNRLSQRRKVNFE